MVKHTGDPLGKSCWCLVTMMFTAAAVPGRFVRAGRNTCFRLTSKQVPARTLDQFPVVRKLGKLSLIGLSTACVTPVFMATGKLGEAQLQRLDGLLQQAADEGQMVVLLIHHPPLPGYDQLAQSAHRCSGA